MYSNLNGNTRKEVYYKSMFCRKWFSILLVFQYGHASRTCFCSLISVLILSPTSSDLVIRSQETVISFCRRILMKPFLSSSFNDLYCHLYRMRNVKCTSIKYIFATVSLLLDKHQMQCVFQRMILLRAFCKTSFP